MSVDSMFVAHHILITAIIGFFGVFFFHFSLLDFFIFVIGGFFMDVDHIFSYWYYKQDFSLNYNKIKQWCMEIGYLMNHFFLFHSFWFVVVLWWLQKSYPSLTLLFYGVLLHASLDIVVDMYWYYILKKNMRPYRRWFAPKALLEKIGLEKIL